jgi:hypothetical protein
MAVFPANNLFSHEPDDCIICRYNCTFPDPVTINPATLLPSQLQEAERSGVPMVPPGPAVILPGEDADDDIVIGTADEVDNRLAGR